MSKYHWTCVLRGHRWHHRGRAQGCYRSGECRRCIHTAPPFDEVDYAIGLWRQHKAAEVAHRSLAAIARERLQ